MCSTPQAPFSTRRRTLRCEVGCKQVSEQEYGRRLKLQTVQKELVDPALQGTRNVLKSVAKHKKSVKRLILTSSFAGKGVALRCKDTIAVVIPVHDIERGKH